MTVDKIENIEGLHLLEIENAEGIFGEFVIYRKPAHYFSIIILPVRIYPFNTFLLIQDVRAEKRPHEWLGGVLEVLRLAPSARTS
jgi:hypothetical protein